VRPKDAHIPDDDNLFRTLPAAKYRDDIVLPEAIEVEGTSCYRRSVCLAPHVALAHARTVRPTDEAVAVVTVAELPKGEITTGGGGRWIVFVEDLPEQGNEAHCEIRFGRPDSREHSWPGKKNARLLLRSTIARLFRVIVAPNRNA